MKKILSLSLITIATLMLSGCGSAEVKPEVKQTSTKITAETRMINNIKNIKELEGFYFSVNEKDTLKSVFSKVKTRLPEISFIVGKNVDFNNKFNTTSSVSNINFKEYLELLNKYGTSNQKLEMKLEGTVYVIDVVK